MSDLHTALEAAIRARLDVARAATPGPWPTDGCDIHAPGLAREIKTWSGGSYVEKVWVVVGGESPAVEEAAADADFIALHDPADAIRRYERDLKTLERHEPCSDCGGESAHYNTAPACHRCGDVYPCEPITDLLDVYPEVKRP